MEFNYNEFKRAIKNNNYVVLDDMEYMGKVNIKITKFDDVIMVHFKKGLYGTPRAFTIPTERVLKMKKCEFLDMVFQKYIYLSFKFEGDL